MPCYGPEPTAEEIARDWEERLRHNSPTADAFCQLCQYLDDAGIGFDKASPKAAAWWQEHRGRDRKRAAEELAEKKTQEDRKALLDRLTSYERRLLGFGG